MAFSIEQFPYTFKQGAMVPKTYPQWTFTLRSPSWCTCPKSLHDLPEYKKSIKVSCGEEGSHYYWDFQRKYIPSVIVMTDEDIDMVKLTVEETTQISAAVSLVVRD